MITREPAASPVERSAKAEAIANHRARIVASARAWIGTPYVHQGSCRGGGSDCLGLLRGVWRSHYGEEPEPVPPYAPDGAVHASRQLLLDAACRNLTAIPRASMGAGDVLLFRWRATWPPTHCGILTTSVPAAFVHAYSGHAVCESFLSSWWSEHLCAVFQFPSPSEAPLPGNRSGRDPHGIGDSE